MTGRATTDYKENKARQTVGLPESVQLVFYPEPRNESSKVDVLEWSVHEILENYTVLTIQTETRKQLIHAGILAFMQEPRFMELNRN